MDRIYKLILNLSRETKTKINMDDTETIELKNNIQETRHEIEEHFSRLPGNNGFYLKLIVGDLNLTLPTAELKRKYKEDYEKWKLHCTFAILGSSSTENILTKMKNIWKPEKSFFDFKSYFRASISRSSSFIFTVVVLLHIDCTRKYIDC